MIRKIKTIKISVMAFFISITGHLYSQTPILNWAGNLGGTSSDYSRTICTDNAGNIYAVGYFEATADFDPGPGTNYLTPIGLWDVYIAKYDNNGNFIWAKQFGGPGSVFPTLYNPFNITRQLQCLVDNVGNLIISGDFGYTADFDPGPSTYNLTSSGGGDVFICSLDPNGNLNWVNRIGDIGDETNKSINISGSSIYITGDFYGTVDFNPGAGIFNMTSVNNRDTYVACFNSLSGNFLWAKQFASISTMAGGANSGGKDIDIDNSGNVYIVGEFADSVDFDPGLSTFYLYNNITSTYIVKLNSAGNFIWAKQLSGYNNIQGTILKIDSNNNLILIGTFDSTIDFDPNIGVYNLSPIGSSDIYILNLDQNGNFIWAEQIGGIFSSTLARSFSINNQNMVLVGQFNNTVDFDPSANNYSLVSNGGYDIFVCELDLNGIFNWAINIGNSSAETAYDVKYDAFGDIILTGEFINTVDFDHTISVLNLTSWGGTDVFIEKLKYCSTVSGVDVVNACNFYTWIDGNTYTASNNSATFNIVGGSANGCDSIVTLNLTINNSNTGTDIITSCNSYTWIDGNTYTSSNNTATHLLTNAAGCDSLVTLNLTINSVSDITTSVSGISITANNTTATYQWLNCDNSYAIIGGEIGQTFSATANGNYAVEITENGCVDTSSCVAITTVGILENTFGDKFVVYPNPTSGNFSIDLGAIYENSQISIIDITGKLIDSKIMTQSQIINLSIEEPDGIYIVSIQSGDKKAVVRVIKE